MKEFLDKAAKAYYEGSPIISDEQFDFLANSFGYKKLGYQVENGVTLPYRMYSLKNVFQGETRPLQEYDLVSSPKLDGAAVALIYVLGNLKAIITRGDGVTGINISHLIPSFPAPKTIKTDKEFLQISGEVVADKSIPRARNYVSGALGLKDEVEFSKRKLMFAAYGVNPKLDISYTVEMRKLMDMGFTTVIETDWSCVQTDGTVYRVDNNKLYEELGFTAKYPRGAFAYKVQKEGVVTTLLDVVWQVGKSGVVSPVAILEPVDIGGVTVSRATLHNIAYIETLGLEIGCKVSVIRSGEVIPRIVKRFI